MCIICIKKRGVAFPSKKQMEAMMTNNPDGNALMYHVRGESQIRRVRTLSDEAFLKAYREITGKYSPEDISMVVHTRIKTHGSAKVKNTHCWYDKSTKLGFAHNGVLSIKNRDDMTDSETFFRDVFVPAFLYGGWNAGERAINAIIGTSKFAFLDITGEIHHYGTYIEEKRTGLLFSNSSYEERRYTTNYYGGRYTCYDDYYASHWNSAYTKPKTSIVSSQATVVNPKTQEQERDKTSFPTITAQGVQGDGQETVFCAEEGTMYRERDFDAQVWGLSWREFKKFVESWNKEFYAKRKSTTAIAMN